MVHDSEFIAVFAFVLFALSEHAAALLSHGYIQGDARDLTRSTKTKLALIMVLLLNSFYNSSLKGWSFQTTTRIISE